jgi:purine nucleoside phosphorylase
MQKTKVFLENRSTSQPMKKIGLAKGLGKLSPEIVLAISFAKTQHFPFDTIEGHHGHLVFEKINHPPIVTKHMNIPYSAISLITDLGVEEKIVAKSHQEVQVVASKTEPKITAIINKSLAQRYPSLIKN